MGQQNYKLSAKFHMCFSENHANCYFELSCVKLTAAAIGGTNFLRDNGIEQDFVKNVIHLDNGKFTVLPTHFTAIMPTAPLLDSKRQMKKEKNIPIIIV